ncbi:ELKS/Rab6-interacting/CAST family member 1 isoform X2 [Drosophila sulfurigaster albostrigata]|uniref:ELKS/Rab6-interacting/CAST family member 1 isoform X2 n=1 Tax=Drosophila sulfurigaster albostrigata TaxID=89887 RepID=UPI002D2186CF|nr:ELKS/Rab6-interacting/CAST family member 1 isoform X2 [Drosophila sulfurigaster albostrigata]
MQNSKPDSSAPTAIKAPLRSPSKISLLSKQNVAVRSPRDSSSLGRGAIDCTSSTSVCSRRTDLHSEDSTAKLKNKFTQPRTNKITELRLKRLQNAMNNDGQPPVASPRAKKETIPITPAPATLPDPEVGDSPTPKSPLPTNAAPSTPASSPPTPQLESMVNKLADLQSEFLQQVKNLKEESQPISFKFVTMVRNEQCQLVFNKDDLLSLPKNIPAESVGDLKSFCRKSFEDITQSMFEDLHMTGSLANLEQLRNKIQKNSQSKVELINAELSKLCCAKDMADTSSILQSNENDIFKIEKLKVIVSKLESDLGDVRRNRDELKKSLDVIQKKNQDLAIELADQNFKGVEQSVEIEDLRKEMKQLMNTNNIMQQRLKDNETTLEQSKEMNSNQIADLKNQLDNALTAKTSLDQSNELTCRQIAELKKQWDNALAAKQMVETRLEELTKNLADKDQKLSAMQMQLVELEQYKDWQSVQSDQSSNREADLAQINELKTKLDAAQHQLSTQTKAEHTLRAQLTQKQKQLGDMELKVTQLEESVVHHRKMNDVRRERIVHLDQEIKQREKEHIRKLDEIMAQSNEKSTIIAQINNELSATNEQFQNLCSTLGTKQMKLHRQEHVIKLLEESNERSVRLHTKLGEKNALLKDELEHLRRTVSLDCRNKNSINKLGNYSDCIIQDSSILSPLRNNLMLGSDATDADAKNK